MYKQNGNLGKLLPGWRYSEIPVNCWNACLDTELIFVLKPFFQKDLWKCGRELIVKWWKFDYIRNRSFPLYVISEKGLTSVPFQFTYHLLLWQTSPVRTTSPVDTLKTLSTQKGISKTLTISISISFFFFFLNLWIAELPCQNLSGALLPSMGSSNNYKWHLTKTQQWRLPYTLFTDVKQDMPQCSVRTHTLTPHSHTRIRALLFPERVSEVDEGSIILLTLIFATLPSATDRIELSWLSQFMSEWN